MKNLDLDKVELDLLEDEIDEEAEAFVVTSWKWRISQFLKKVLPFLTRECPFEFRHWKWEKLCTCGYGVLIDSSNHEGWHGGLYDLKLDQELQPCLWCNKKYAEMRVKEMEAELSDDDLGDDGDDIENDYTKLFGQKTKLTTEEQCLVECWREYRTSLLDHYGETGTYKYQISVKMNGLETFLMSREQVHPLANDNSNLFVKEKLKDNDKLN